MQNNDASILLNNYPQNTLLDDLLDDVMTTLLQIAESMLINPPTPVVMTTSHFARIPQYNPAHQCDSIYTQEDPWGQGHSSSHTLNGTLQSSDFGDQECVIANGYPLSPATSPVSTRWGEVYHSYCIIP